MLSARRRHGFAATCALAFALALRLPAQAADAPTLDHTLWKSLGPTTVLDGQVGVSNRAREMTGRVIAVRIHRTQPGLWLIGTAAGGIWRTENSGDSWKPTAFPPVPPPFKRQSLTVGSIDFVSDGCTAYAGTGDIVGSVHTYPGTGLLVSDDCGKKWEALPATVGPEANPQPFSWSGTRVAALVTTKSACGGPDAHDIWILTSPAPATFFGTAPVEGPSHGVFYAGGVVPKQREVRFTRAPVAGRMLDLTADGDGHLYIGWSHLDQQGGDIAGVRRIRIVGCHGEVRQSEVAPYDGFARQVKATIGRHGTLYASFVNGSHVSLFRIDNASSCTPPCDRKSIPFAVGTLPEMKATPGYCSWHPSRPDPLTDCNHHNLLRVHPSNPDTLFGGGVALFKCTDCAPPRKVQWTDVSHITPVPPARWQDKGIGSRHGIHVDQQSADWDAAGKRLVVGNDGGIWSTLDEGATWENHNFGGLAITQTYRGALDPRRPGVVFAGTQDLGTIRRDGWRWRTIQGGDGLGIAVSHKDPATHWVTIQKSDLYKDNPMWRTQDGGLTYQRADLGILKDSLLGGPRWWAPPLAQCPDRDRDVVLYGKFSLWRVDNLFRTPTTRAFDGASTPTWRPIWALPYHPPPAPYVTPPLITAIAFRSEGRKHEGCATFAFADAKGTVRQLDEQNDGFAPTSLGSLPFHVYALASGFRAVPWYAAVATPNGDGGVYAWDPSLQRWTNLIPESLSQTFRALVVVRHPSADVLIAGGDFGIWMSPRGEAGWCRLPIDEHTPHPPIMDLKAHPITKDVYAFTFGRGVFRLGDVTRAVKQCEARLGAKKEG